MRTPLVAGNWKMHGSRDSVATLTAGILAGAGEVPDVELLVCPPFVYLPQVAQLSAGSRLRLGGQNLCTEPSGAYTGEVSGAMLRDIGCHYVIVGHSERRALYGESNSTVAAKFMAAQQNNLVPVLCVGETLEQRKAGITQQVIDSQLQAVIDLVGIAALSRAVVAYEPVWAIGTGEVATPDQAQTVHAALRALVAGQDARIAADLRLLYGGSVKSSNAAELFAMPDIDGGLIGGASLDAAEFLAIGRAARQAS